jgi:hypothetical protein
MKNRQFTPGSHARLVAGREAAQTIEDSSAKVVVQYGVDLRTAVAMHRPALAAESQRPNP